MPTTSTKYTLGYGQAMENLLRSRTAENSAAYLLHHLEPGMRLLDCGCGPGSISTGLAQAVRPGEFQGLDLEASQIEKARLAAENPGCGNARFQAGDVTDLPFENDRFDVVHCHALMMHVPDTPALLKEMKRVLKPGGLLAARELIASASFLQCRRHSFGEMMTMFQKLVEANGGHPELGKELKPVVRNAGFSKVLLATTTFECFDTVEEMTIVIDFFESCFFNPKNRKAAIDHGLATEEQLARWQNQLQDCRHSPDALFAHAWGEILVRKT